MTTQHGHISPIAIDIGSSGIKMLQIEHAGDRPLISAAAYRALPCDLSAGERREAAFAAIGSMISTHHFRGRGVVSALQPPDFQIKSLRLPRMPAEEMAQAVQFEAAERFGFGADGGEYRYLAAGDVRQGTEIREELIVFGAAGATVQQLLDQFSALRLEAVAIDAAPCATARAFSRFLRREQDSAAVNVFLDIGWSASSFVMTRGANVVFVKPIEVGGRHFDEAVSTRLGIAPEAAHELRQTAMQDKAGEQLDEGIADATFAGSASADPGSESVRGELAEAMRAPVEQLAKEVQLCLRYFAVTFRGHRPDCVTLVGGEAAEPALAAWMPGVLALECPAGDPLRRMHVAVAGGLPESDVFRPGWSVAAGLALRGSRWIRALTATAGSAA